MVSEAILYELRGEEEQCKVVLSATRYPASSDGIAAVREREQCRLHKAGTRLTMNYVTFHCPSLELSAVLRHIREQVYGDGAIIGITPKNFDPLRRGLAMSLRRKGRKRLMRRKSTSPKKRGFDRTLMTFPPAFARALIHNPATIIINHSAHHRRGFKSLLRERKQMKSLLLKNENRRTLTVSIRFEETVHAVFIKLGLD